MISVFCLCVCIISVQAHQKQLQNDADLQEALMPQELNPEFVSGLDEPLKAVIPLDRLRRSFDQPSHVPISVQLKQYSRLVSCVVLALSAVVEIVLFLIELYNM